MTILFSIIFWGEGEAKPPNPW